MFDVKRLSSKYLFRITTCKDKDGLTTIIRELVDKNKQFYCNKYHIKSKSEYNSFVKKLVDLEVSQLISAVDDQRILNLPLLTHSLITPLGIPDAQQMPLFLLTVIYALKGLGIISLGIISGVASLGAALFGGVFVADNYKKECAEYQKNKEEIACDLFKLKCGAEIFTRHAFMLRKLNRYSKSQIEDTIDELKSYQLQPAKIKNKLNCFKQALYAFSLSSIMLIGVHFFGVCGFLKVAGLIGIAASLTNPVTALITVGVILSLGVYCGYKQYQYYKKQDQIQSAKSFLHAKTDFVEHQCATLQDKINNKLIPETKKHSPHPTIAPVTITPVNKLKTSNPFIKFPPPATSMMMTQTPTSEYPTILCRK